MGQHASAWYTRETSCGVQCLSDKVLRIPLRPKDHAANKAMAATSNAMQGMAVAETRIMLKGRELAGESMIPVAGELLAPGEGEPLAPGDGEPLAPGDGDAAEYHNLHSTST